MKCLYTSSRGCAVLLDEGGDYLAREPRRLMLNGKDIGVGTKAVASLHSLRPDTAYVLSARTEGGGTDELAFRTRPETCALDVRRFGARGDGAADDTAALQAAILCCPPGGRVTLGAGVYRTGPLFLKSRMTLELKKGAVLSLLTDRARFPILPGATPASNAAGEVLLGSWEGNPLDCFASALNGIGVEDVQIVGEGAVDGRAGDGDWWIDPKTPRGAFRGSLLYLRDCRDVNVHGVAFRNSPSWNLHPMFSERLGFYDISVEAPADSPNTDGLDPESCRGVRAYGVRFSVGDDCVAVKAGKVYMGAKYAAPCADVEIAHCLMAAGHGGVTVGSEMSGGVRNVRVRRCRMTGTDRGLRVKTRRGRGGAVQDIRFEDVAMEGVGVPLAVNCMYFCDPDGHAEWVQSRAPRPVDAGTPSVGGIRFERVRASGCRACAAYLLGLPERPVEGVTLRDCEFSFDAGAAAFPPVMADGVAPCARRGIVARFVEGLEVENTRLEGAAEA